MNTRDLFGEAEKHERDLAEKKAAAGRGVAKCRKVSQVRPPCDECGTDDGETDGCECGGSEKV